ncbi:amidohydrolase family protein [Streptomyces antibioticus]|uniref:amidohydrolase family protein n=1 Tax=Streptomyces antibioticus TaxID=1890 RepID=UPI003F4497F8
MLTIHTADLLVTGDPRHPPVPGGAVLVDGRTIAAVGPYEELAEASPTARVRRWPGLLTPGLLNPYGPELLEHAYHPDPREADELGTEPLTGEALAALAPTDTRRGASARRGVQRMLAHGTVAVAGDLWRPAVLDAVRRAGLTVEQRFTDPAGAPTLDPLARDPLVADGGGRSLREAIVTPLAPVPGAAATFAVFDAPDEAALTTRGASCCTATVIDGRLLYRSR